MNGRMIITILEGYSRKLFQLKKRYPHSPDPVLLAHLISMISQMHEMNDVDFEPRSFLTLILHRDKLETYAKLMRRLGFLQGAFWTLGVYTVDQLKEHNRGGPID